MRKLILVIILLIPYFATIAQTSEPEAIPKNYIGINLSGNYAKNTIKTSTKTQIIASTTPFYWRRIKRFVFGTGISFGYAFSKIPTYYNSSNVKYFDTDKYFALSIVPTIRYYSKYNLFITASFIAGKGKGEIITPYNNYSIFNYSSSYSITNIQKNYTSNIIGWDIGLGYAIKAGKSFLIEPTFSFQKTIKDTYYTYYNLPTSIMQNSYYSNSLFTNYMESRDNTNFYFGIGTTYRF
jgi:hypothetical protein